MKFPFNVFLLALPISLCGYYLLNSKTANNSCSPINEPIVFAHRGLPHVAENTAKAFEEAKALGFKAIETDIHFTKDHKLVVFHDKNAKRLLGVDQSIEALNWSEIKDLKILHDGKYTDNTILTLEQLLTNSNNFELVYLDIKPANKIIADSLINLMEKYKAVEHFIVADANILFLAYLKYKNPNIKTVLEGYNKGKEWIYYLIPKHFEPDYWASFYHQVDDEHLKFLINNELINQKIVYGIDQHNFSEALKLGLKHLIVDYHPSMQDLFSN